MKKTSIILITYLFFFLPQISKAQLINELSSVTLNLDNGETIILLEEMKKGSINEGTGNWYYLPSASFFTIPKNKSGKLDYSLYKYTSDGDESCNMVDNQGGIFHCSVQWKMSPSQENEIQQKLRKKAGSRARVKGAITNLKGKQLNFLTVLKDGGIAKDDFKLIGTSIPPTRPGSIIGLQKILSVQDARLIEEEILSKSPSLDFELVYSYVSQVPVGDVKVVFDWSKKQFDVTKIEQEYESWITKRWSKSAELKLQFPNVKALKSPIKAICGIFKGSKAGIKRVEEKNFSYEELNSFYRFLEEKGVITILYNEYNLDSGKSDKLEEKIRSAVFSNLISKISIPTTPTSNNESQSEKMTSSDPEKVNLKGIRSYTIDKQYRRDVTEIKKFEINISATVGIVTDFPVTISVGSLLSECNDCISSINLCDKFYQRIHVSTLPNSKTKAMLRDGVLNYISVAVKKKRAEGDFYSTKTISLNSLNKLDGLAEDFMFKYARPVNDPKFNVYEYEVEFASGSSKQKHGFKGISGKPALQVNIPLFPVLVELNSAASEKMKSLDIIKASAVVIYSQFGKKRYKTLEMNFLKGDASMEETFYMDEESTDFKYYITFRNRNGETFASREYTETKSQIDFESDPTAKQVKEIFIYDELESMKILNINSDGKEVLEGNDLGGYIDMAKDLFDLLKKMK